ncbi:GH25 family lysozyme [Butyrivibrio proteoclasticus]|uniref:GH25 family lysozyme n=1 Tax=Butyrivibrio proteoclasticus TaxID=43305 RepID=UPI0009DD7F9C|nr:GH25 family lysozyme [Butyrivibrio proteoclasticus]
MRKDFDDEEDDFDFDEFEEDIFEEEHKVRDRRARTDRSKDRVCGDSGRTRNTRNKKSSNDDKSGGTNIVTIVGAALILDLAIVIGVLVIKKVSGSRNNSDQETDLFSEIEASTELATEEATTQDASEEDSESSSEASTQASLEASSDASADTDPQAQAKTETGADVDVSQLVSASNVGENTSVTYGIDVSRFQGTINWEQVAGTGIDFAMIRVGYRDAKTGEIKADSNAKYNMQEAEKYGIKIGAYFFSTAISSDEAVEEANWVTSYIAQYPITYPVGYNCEGFDNASSRQVNMSQDDRSAVAMAFLGQIYSAGYTPIFYASQGELAGDAKWNTSTIEQKYKIWIAWYNQDTSSIAKGPAYSGQCAMWQYTNQGTVAGISGKVDVDVAYFGYNGTETAKDTSERETASADVEALMNFKEVNEQVTAKSSTNLRDKPSQGDDSTVVVTLENGQVAQRTGISDSGWSRVVYDGKTLYAVSSYLTTDLNAPKQESGQAQTQDNSGFKTKFTDCNETVTAKDIVNLRNKPSVTDEDSVVVATLSAGETAVRTGYNAEYGWSRVEYNGQVLYCVSSYLTVVN